MDGDLLDFHGEPARFDSKACTPSITRVDSAHGDARRMAVTQGLRSGGKEDGRMREPLGLAAGLHLELLIGICFSSIAAT